MSLGKACLRLLVDEIRLDKNGLVVTGSHRRLADAIGFMEKGKFGDVPSYVNDWCRDRRWGYDTKSGQIIMTSNATDSRGVAYGRH